MGKGADMLVQLWQQKLTDSNIALFPWAPFPQMQQVVGQEGLPPPPPTSSTPSSYQQLQDYVARPVKKEEQSPYYPQIEEQQQQQQQQAGLQLPRPVNYNTQPSLVLPNIMSASPASTASPQSTAKRSFEQMEKGGGGSSNTNGGGGLGLRGGANSEESDADAEGDEELFGGPVQAAKTEEEEEEEEEEDEFEEKNSDAINSDLDDTDDEQVSDGHVDADMSGDLVLCMYDKVSRTKARWKCSLKDGMFSLNGRDWLFHKVQDNTAAITC